jgi:hypothetical protein
MDITQPSGASEGPVAVRRRSARALAPSSLPQRSQSQRQQVPGLVEIGSDDFLHPQVELFGLWGSRVNGDMFEPVAFEKL